MFYTVDNNDLQIKKWQHVGQCDFNFDHLTSRRMPQQPQTEACLITLCPAYFHSCCGICSWHWRPTNVMDWTHRKKYKNKKALQISVPRNKGRQVKRLGNGGGGAICTVPGWNPAAEGLECGGKSCKVQGGFMCRTPSTSNSLWRTDPAALPPPAPLDTLLLCQPRTDRESPTSLSSTDSTEKGEKVVWLLFLWMMSHPDFVSAVRLCLYVGVCVWRTYKLKE